MVPHPRALASLAAAVALAAAGSACRSHTAPGAVDAASALCIPPDTNILAGVDLDRFRASPLSKELPPAVQLAVEPLRDATRLLAAWNGSDVLLVARGQFRQAPAGASLVGPNLAISGTPTAVSAARTQRETGRSGAPELVRRAEPAAARGVTLWIAAQGTASLPGGGDFANLNRLLHLTDYATLSAKLDSGLELEARGYARTPELAQKLEENARGLLSLAAAMARQQEIAALLRSARVRRKGSTVEATLSAGPEPARALLRRLSR